MRRSSRLTVASKNVTLPNKGKLRLNMRLFQASRTLNLRQLVLILHQASPREGEEARKIVERVESSPHSSCSCRGDYGAAAAFDGTQCKLIPLGAEMQARAPSRTRSKFTNACKGLKSTVRHPADFPSALRRNERHFTRLVGKCCTKFELKCLKSAVTYA